MSDKNIENNIELEKQIESLSIKVKILEEEVQTNWELFLRAKADFENFRKRADKEVINITKYANKNILLDLLPLLDSFEASFISIKTNVKTDVNINNNPNIGDNDNVYFLFYKLFLGVFEKHEVKKMNVNEYDFFDPSKHEVVSIINNEIYDNVIASVLQSGYELHDHVLRYAKISIFKKVIENK
ncbi:MAG TPA: nucleotide exchange factor GrpE [Candidatus Azoamicus sp.]